MDYLAENVAAAAPCTCLQKARLSARKAVCRVCVHGFLHAHTLDTQPCVRAGGWVGACVHMHMHMHMHVCARACVRHSRE